ncbi:hypothetical protein ACFGD2_021310 [Citrobacter freundii]
MNIGKINALKSVILKRIDIENLPEIVPEEDIIRFFKQHSLWLSCSSLRNWLSGAEEPSDEMLMKIMEKSSWRCTAWSGRNP